VRILHQQVGELESKFLEVKLENDSLKLTPTISDDVECSECNAWLNEIKMLNEKNASTLAKLDALRTEYDELKARPTFLGACKSCPTMHAKLVDARSTFSITSTGRQEDFQVPTICPWSWPLVFFLLDSFSSWFF
jgi:hypothetical protein